MGFFLSFRGKNVLTGPIGTKTFVLRFFLLCPKFGEFVRGSTIIMRSSQYHCSKKFTELYQRRLVTHLVTSKKC